MASNVAEGRDPEMTRLIKYRKFISRGGQGWRSYADVLEEREREQERRQQPRPQQQHTRRQHNNRPAR